jgi:hypothetical protein
MCRDERILQVLFVMRVEWGSENISFLLGRIIHIILFLGRLLDRLITYSFMEELPLEGRLVDWVFSVAHTGEFLNCEEGFSSATIFRNRRFNHWNWLFYKLGWSVNYERCL